MKYLEEVERTGKIPGFNAEQLIAELYRYDGKKPSSRIITTKKGRAALGVLQNIQENHNHSWYREIKIRAKRNPDALAIFYRGKKINFREMFEKADAMAKSMAAMGLTKGDEVPCCVSNTPELIYMMLAASKLGLKLNMFGTHLDKGYMESILNSTSKKLIIMTDENYARIKDTVDKCDFDKKVVFSLADSLPDNPKVCDEYVPDLDRYYRIPNLVPQIKTVDPSIISLDEFMDIGKEYDKPIVDTGKLDTEFLITYTSGSTHKGFPKQIVHSNRSLIVSGTFNDMELSGSPKIPYQRGMCYIHTESNTNLVTCISDNLMKLWSVACEPVYSKNTALDVIRLNSPSMVEMTTSHLVQMAKDYLEAEKRGKKYKFPHLIATFAVGEATSPGEEKFINTVLRKARAGSEVTVKGIRLPFAPLSVGGGDCEHGGIFYNVFNNIKSRINSFRTGKKDLGMSPVVFGVITALKDDGSGHFSECDYDEYGIIVANTATNMVGYKDDKEKTLKKIIRDSSGRDWLSCDVYGYIDKLGNVHQRDRVGSEIFLPNGKVVLPSMIYDVVVEDTKNILSCTVTKVKTDNGDIPIINFELSPLKKKGRRTAIISMNERIKAKLGRILGDNYRLREITNDTSFDLSGSGKRDIVALEQKGLTGTFRVRPKTEIDQTMLNEMIENSRQESSHKVR